MKDIIVAIIVSLCIIFAGFVTYYKINEEYNRIEIQRDTVIITAPDYSLIKQNDSLCYIVDSLQNLNLKLEEELNIALFKIDRIKEYNRIAGNGNNIKYLRGWINRTLNE